MKKNLKEEINRIKQLNKWLLRESYEDWDPHYDDDAGRSLRDSENGDNYADETYGDEHPQGVSDDGDIPQEIIDKWYNELNIDKLISDVGWEKEITDGLERPSMYGSYNKKFYDYTDMHLTYTIASPSWLSDDERKIVVRVGAEVVDSWPEQKQGLEQEPIAAGYDMGVSYIMIEEPIKKVLHKEELKAFEQLNPNFVSSAEEEVGETAHGDYDGDY